MKEMGNRFLITFGGFDQRYIRVLVLAATLVLFLLTGGAPETGGDCSGC
jgi:hypothetical protein